MQELWIVSNLPPPVHGVSAFNQALIQELDKREIEFRFFRIGTSGDIGSLEKWRFKKLFSDLTRIGWVAVLAFKERLRGRAPVLYFTPAQYGFAILRDFVLSLFCGLFGRVVAHIHGCRWLEEAGQNGFRAKLMPLVLRRCNQVICLGPSYAKEMSKKTGFPCVGINNGSPDPGNFVPKHDPKQGEPLQILFLSNLWKAKGLWLVAEALRKLKEEGVSVVLTCAGKWVHESEEEEFHQEFKNEIKNGSIRLVGFAESSTKSKLLTESHLLVLPTLNRNEGQPLALIESLAYGLPALSVPVGGIPDLYQFQGGELLCSEKHETALGIAQTIQSLLAQRGSLNQLSLACRSHYEKFLSFSHCVDSLLMTLAEKVNEK